MAAGSVVAGPSLSMRRRTFLALGVAGIGAACVPSAPVAARRVSDAGDAAADASAGSSADTGVPASSPSPDAAGGSDASADAGAVEEDAATLKDAGAVDAAEEPPVLDAGVCESFVQLHDTHAQALYFDGTYGPLTGVCTVDYVLANVSVDLEFWHGHNGQQHHFVLLPEHFAALKRGERVTLETTEVDSHQHLLFIDPTDENYRVRGAPDVAVPLC